MIRTATAEDLERILDLFASARAFMAAQGNPQWTSGGPDRETLDRDLDRGELYVAADEAGIWGVFALVFGEEPTYARIEGGTWLDSTPYATLHRVAAAGPGRGLVREAVRFAETKISHLRIDTHEKNTVMRRAILSQGFVYCGMIHVADGTPRLAYERTGGIRPD